MNEEMPNKSKKEKRKKVGPRPKKDSPKPEKDWRNLPDPQSLNARKNVQNYLNELNKAIEELRAIVEAL